MVSRSNLSGRSPYSGVLGRVYKGPSGPGKITPPGMETPARNRGKRLLEGRDAGPIDAGGVSVPGSGAESPARKPRRGKGIFNQVKSAIEQQRDKIESDRAAKYPTTSPGVGETAYRPGYTDADAARAATGKQRDAAAVVVETARTERELAQNAGGTESLVSMSRSPRSRSRRNIR